MNEILSLIKTSKTAKSGVVTIIVGLLLLLGIGNPEEIADTIDDVGCGGQSSMQTIVGIGALLSGLTTLKGRNDVEKRVKGIEDAKAKD